MGHGKCVFYPHISLINHSYLCVYLRFRNKYRRNNCRRWIKSIINKFGKSGHEKLTFAIFICRNMNWTILVQTMEQQWLWKERGQHIDYEGQRKTRRTKSILWWNQIVSCEILRISWFWGFNFIRLSFLGYINPLGEMNNYLKIWRL